MAKKTETTPAADSPLDPSTVLVRIAEALEGIQAVSTAILGLANLHYGKKAVSQQASQAAPVAVDDAERAAAPVASRGSSSKKSKAGKAEAVSPAATAVADDDTTPPSRGSLQEAVSDAAANDEPSATMVTATFNPEDEDRLFQLISQLGSPGPSNAKPSDQPILTMEAAVPGTNCVVLLDFMLTLADDDADKPVYCIQPVVCEEVPDGKETKLNELNNLELCLDWSTPIVFEFKDQFYAIPSPEVE